MSELPKGWVQCQLGDVVDYGSTIKADPNSIASDTWVLELEDIEKDSSKLLGKISFKERKSKSTKNIFRKGDVLYGKLRPYLNKVIIAEHDGVCSSEIIPLTTPENLINNRYLFCWLKNKRFLDYVNAVSYGVNMPRLGTGDGQKAPMIVAPQAEQTRIVEKLDEVLAQVDTIKTRLDSIPAILKRFRQSVLAAAVSGRLTEEWRGKFKDLLLTEERYFELVDYFFKSKKKVDQKRVINIKEQDWFYIPNSLPEGWVSSFLIDITHVITCGVAKKPEYTEAGIRFLSAQNSKPFAPNLNGIRYISENDYKTFTVGAKPEKGDVLYSRVGANFGEACVIPWDFDFAIYVSLTLLKPINELISGDYLTLFLNSQDGVLQSRGGIMGSGIQNLNVESVRKYKLGLPSLEEQKEIVRLVDQYFAFADAIEVQVKKAQTRVDNLTQSILAKAFRGELVAQDPSDEPAEKLLERIAQAKKEAEALAKTAKKVAKTK